MNFGKTKNKMTINNQLDAIFEHPAFKLAIQRVREENDLTDLRHLFFEITWHTYEKSTLNARRTYGKVRWMEQTCKILEEIGLTAPPDNLDLRLAIPSKRLFTKEKPEHRQRRPIAKLRKLIIDNPDQLILEFQQTA